MTPFAVLAEPTRRHILDLLLAEPRSVGELVHLLGASQPATSKHLRVLRDAGLVRSRPVAQQRRYELRPGPLAEVDAWLAPYRDRWERALDALERHLEDTTTRTNSVTRRPAAQGGASRDRDPGDS
jgi:DNA-binding transcriptional ArsR family regulator